MLELDETQPLRIVFHNLETTLRSGGKYADPRSWPLDVQGVETVARPEALKALLETILRVCLTRWEQVRTPGDLADALEDICTVLLEHGANLWNRFPIDAECLHRLLYSVIPGLRQCSLSARPFPPLALFTILRESLRGERVPFEAEPLVGMQLLGMREARLLRFRQVYVLGATDDRLPGSPGFDPLFPDSLRRLAGLPDSRQREREKAWTFFCLVRSAEDVMLFYETGVQGTGLLEKKSIRSRFIEELLWDEEQRQGRILEPGQPPVSMVVFPMRPIPRHNRRIPRSPAIQQRLTQLLELPLSPSMLDVYLLCPARFYYQRIAGLEPLATVDEDGDPAELGSIVHGVLNDFFMPYRGRALEPGTVDARTLLSMYSERLHASTLFAGLSRDRQLLLEQTGRFRLEQYVRSMPQTTIRDLEQRREATLTCASGTFRLVGKLDRIDQRVEGTIILDYKTGGIKIPGMDFREGAPLLATLEAGCPSDPEAADTLLSTLAEAMPSVQLPCYLFLQARHGGETPNNAALVELRRDGQEHPLFDKELPQEQRSVIVQTHIPHLLAFIVDHMLTGPYFSARAGAHCQWCAYRNACERS